MDNLLIVFAVISLMSVALFFGLVGVEWVRRRLSRNWPWAQSSIGEGRITACSGRGGDMYKLIVSYSYSVAGNTYTGKYSEICESQSAAEGSLRSLKDMPPPARYKAGKPQVSVMDPYRDAALVFEHPKAPST